jgi:Leucine-rich repeat (LRR) protein
LYLNANNPEFISLEKKNEPIDFSKITFLYIDDENFDGDLEFIEQCTNITHIYLDGSQFKTKIKTLQHLRTLKKLVLLNVANNEINNLESVSLLHNLRHLWIFGNKIDSIQSISILKNLLELRCRFASHQEVYNLLQSIVMLNTKVRMKNFHLEQHE